MRPVIKRLKITGALISNTLKPIGKVDPWETSPAKDPVLEPASSFAEFPGTKRPLDCLRTPERGDTTVIVLLNLKEIRRSQNRQTAR